MDEIWLYHYDPETKQQSMEWRQSGSPRPAPKNSQCKNPLEMFSPRFFGGDQDGILLIDYLPKGQTVNAEYYSSLLVQLKDILKEKRHAAGRSPSESCSCMTMPWFTGHLQRRRYWPTWTSIVLITHPILRIWPHRTTTCSLDWKINWKVAFFCLTWRSLLLWRPCGMDNFLNFFWVACRSWSNRLRSVLSFVGSMLNKPCVWLL